MGLIANHRGIGKPSGKGSYADSDAPRDPLGALTGQSVHVFPMHPEESSLRDVPQVIVCSSYAFDEAFELLSVKGVVGIAALAFQVIDDDAHELEDLIGARLSGQRC